MFENILFLDIETVPEYPDYSDLPEVAKKLWDKKSKHIARSDEDTPESLYERAGIYAEFGKIICISVGVFQNEKLYIKSFYDDEVKILEDFAKLVNSMYEKNQNLTLCAHNGKEFDFPYICRRMLVNGIKIPAVLDVSGKKPWEVKFIDTMELWKFGDNKSYTSLELLSYVFNIPSPKNEIDGSKIKDVFYKEKNIKRIVEYCQQDVITVFQLLRKYYYLPLIDESQIVYR